MIARYALAMLTSALCFVLATAVASPPQPRAGGDLSHELFPGGVPLDAQGRPTHAVVRIVSALDRAPLPGARMSAVVEASCPLPGVWWATRTTVADEHGFARLRIDDIEPGPWIFFEADGHATLAEHGGMPGPLVVLEPGIDVEIEVRDGFEQPVAGASIGRIVGCGHTPDVVVARTDARGRATLRSIDPGSFELWPVAEGFASEYLDLPRWRPGDDPLVLRLRPGSIVEGVVRDRDGKPVPRVFVGEPKAHRSPWTQADALGRFRLVGASASPFVHVIAESGAQPPLGVFDVVGDVPCTLVVPPVDDLPRTRVRVALVDVATKAPAEKVTLTAVRLEDGNAERRTTDASGIVEIELRPGCHSLRAGGGREHASPPAWEETVREIVLGDEPLDLRLELTAMRRWYVMQDIVRLPREGRLELASTEAVWDVTQHHKQWESVLVPRTGRLALRVVLGERVHVEEIGAADRSIPTIQGFGMGSAQVFPCVPESTVVRARLVDDEGHPVRGFGAFAYDASLDVAEIRGLREDSSPASELAIPTWEVGSRWLVVVPEDDALRPARVPLSISERDPSVEVGLVRLTARAIPELVVLRADGSPAAGAVLVVRRPGFSVRETLDEHGTFVGDAALVAEDEVVVEGDEGTLPLRARLEGDGPWTLRWPSGAVAVEASDESGRPLGGFSLWVQNELVEGAANKAIVRGLVPGGHDIVVTAPGRLARVFSIELGDGETHRLTARLPIR